jgi:hypothetical protein
LEIIVQPRCALFVALAWQTHGIRTAPSCVEANCKQRAIAKLRDAIRARHDRPQRARVESATRSLRDFGRAQNMRGRGEQNLRDRRKIACDFTM